MSSEGFIIEDKIITEELAELKVRKLNPLSWIIMLIIAFVPVAVVLPFFQFAMITVILSFILAIIIAPILWKKAGSSLLRTIFIKDFESWKNEGKDSNIFRKLINSLLGITISSDYKYYLEGSVAEVNLNSLKTVLSKRIFNVSSASIGISFTIGTILKLTLPETQQTSQVILGTSLVIMLLSPLILFWLIPLIWAVQDANIKYSDKNQKIGDVGEKISRGTLRKIIGVTGITLAFSFILDSNIGAMSSAQNVVQKYAFAAFMLVLIIALSIGACLLSGIIYLNFNHQKVVNTFRKDLAKVLTVGVTSVRKASEGEQVYFQ